MEKIIQEIKKHSTFYIFGHTDPDGDCVGSQLGLALFLKQLGKKAFVYSKGKFERLEIQRFRSQFSETFAPCDKDGVVIIVDCSTPDRTGFENEGLDRFPVIVIDHHSSGTEFGDFRHVVPQASSCTMPILDLIEAMGEKPSKEVAELLMLGLCTDTGFFIHLTETGAKAFRTAAKLSDLGASTNRIYYDVNGNKKADTLKLISQSLGRATRYLDGRLMITWETLDDYRTTPRECRDIDTVYMLLLATEGVQVVASVKEDSKDKVSVGLRTRCDNIDLGAAAAMLGGGGHKKAAGCKIMNSSAKAVVELLVEHFSKILV
ncbi:MAG: bifunctional oligoribonuclease/PAP phosphatase NrnA [Spirochaetia bacterium]|nr:bifunctional oligoribonuclease/PAP phosphatase NrnA [Spirochaetia bacterium]MBQ3648172.1 bifunctional oligoribonuclease/PAP phosphatase NrnA [Spirochaetia bacterium]MBQ3713128.1 bifunctional oligoribonuclease/PAP phosphatase NrnA [Spirochaetia bacterium]MBQ6904590.1 bifunctional oligoribonuclease/PAP phosphatase NrnA [Spirochaetia bacterium]